MRLILLVLTCFCLSSAWAKQKIIIDTDPGVDDLLAISLAIKSPDVDVLGITTVFGNVTTKQATTNALNLVEYFGHDIPVYEGAYLPLDGSTRGMGESIHGLDGMGNLFLPLPTIRAQKLPAAHFIVEAINQNPKQITLLVLGPQTNLADALRLDPSIAHKVKEVVIMGGAFETKGNITEHSEWNIWQDAVAAQKVAQAKWSKVYIGLDVTEQVIMSNHLLLEIADLEPMLGNFLLDATSLYFDFHRDHYKMENLGFMHDPTAFLYITQPNAFQMKQGHIEVDTDKEKLGKTNYHAKGKDARIAFQVDAPHLLNAFKRTLVESNVG